MTRKILNAQTTAFTLAVLVLVSQISKGKMNASISEDGGVTSYEVADDSGKLKQFATVEAVVKHVAKFAGIATDITVEMVADAYAPTTSVGDPSAALLREKTKIGKELARIAIVIATETADIDAATALGWATGSAAQQAQLAEQILRRTIVNTLKTALEARLVVLG